jgi:hypothetical protein
MSTESGASVPHAAVAIKNTDTNVIINVTTNGTGYYEVWNLNPGNYDASVAASGFEKTVHSGIVLPADGHPSIDLALKVGNSNQTVVVEEDSPLIDTQSVSIGQVLTSEEMSALPMDRPLSGSPCSRPVSSRTILRTINWEAPILAGTGQGRSLAHSGASEPMSLALTAPRTWQIKEVRQSISLQKS